jgi:hypothetical protein
MTVPFPRMVSLIKVGDLGEEGSWVFCQWVEPDPIDDNCSDLMRWSALSKLYMNFVDTHVEKGANSEHAEQSQNKNSLAQIRQTGEQHIVSKTNVKGASVGMGLLQSKGMKKDKMKGDRVAFLSL